MTTVVKVAGVALSLTAVAAGLCIGGLVFMIYTRERKLADWAGERDE